MKNLKIGDRVRIVRGAASAKNLPHDVRVGHVATIVAVGAMPHGGFPEVPRGTLVCALDTTPSVVAPPSWLEPFCDGKEAAEWTEELRELCGMKTREEA